MMIRFVLFLTVVSFLMCLHGPRISVPMILFLKQRFMWCKKTSMKSGEEGNGAAR